MKTYNISSLRNPSDPKGPQLQDVRIVTRPDTRKRRCSGRRHLGAKPSTEHQPLTNNGPGAWLQCTVSACFC